MIYIYGLIDPRNELTIENVRYIGKTNQKNPKRRLYKHIQDSKNGIAPKHKWIRKLKIDNVKPEMIILKECNENNWKFFEKKYISDLRKSNRLLNVTDGGEEVGNFKPPKKKVYCYDENGDFICKYESLTIASKINKISISKISSALNQKNNKTANNKYWFTKPTKKEEIKFRKVSKRNIPIIQEDLDGNLIAEFKSQAEAERLTGINAKLINKCLKNKTYTQTNGYKWKYK